MEVKHSSDRLAALALGGLISLPMAIRAAINLRVFNILAEAGPAAYLTPSEIVKGIPTTNPNAATALNRILRILAANSLLTVSYGQDGGKEEPSYGMTSLALCLVPGDDGFSTAAEFLLGVDKATVASFYYLEDAVREEGCVPFEKAHGISFFEFGAGEARYTKLFQEAMSNISAIAMQEVFEVYRGFEEVKEIIDVGGGVGTCLSMIVAKYPHIHAVNFDLPYIIDGAPHYPGVKHVAGNMFEGVPKAETIFMKGIIHDWDDESCLKLLKNCWEALPEGGKIINIENVVPPQIETDFLSRRMTGLDIIIMCCTTRGKERTLQELSDLVKLAGFVDVKDFPVAHAVHVIEFHK